MPARQDFRYFYLMAKYMNNGLNTGLSLDKVLHKYLGILLEKNLHLDFQNAIKCNSFIDWHQLEHQKGFDNIIKYMILDVFYLHALSQKLKTQMTDTLFKCYTICESQFLMLFVKMSVSGIPIDSTEYHQRSEQARFEVDEAYKLFIEKHIQPNVLDDWFSSNIKKKFVVGCGGV